VGRRQLAPQEEGRQELHAPQPRQGERAVEPEIEQPATVDQHRRLAALPLHLASLVAGELLEVVEAEPGLLEDLVAQQLPVLDAHGERLRARLAQNRLGHGDGLFPVPAQALAQGDVGRRHEHHREHGNAMRWRRGSMQPRARPAGWRSVAPRSS
jgi:hypothetical protein